MLALWIVGHVNYFQDKPLHGYEVLFCKLEVQAIPNEKGRETRQQGLRDGGFHRLGLWIPRKRNDESIFQSRCLHITEDIKLVFCFLLYVRLLQPFCRSYLSSLLLLTEVVSQ